MGILCTSSSLSLVEVELDIVSVTWRDTGDARMGWSGAESQSMWVYCVPSNTSYA